jgi:hypothetical protein
MRQAFPALALALIAAPAGADDPGSKAPRVELLTPQGTIVLELDAAVGEWLDAPERVAALQERFDALHRQLRCDTSRCASDAIEKILHA